LKIIEQGLQESNAYSLFVYAIRLQITRDYYLRRLRIFFNRINLEPDKTIEERCNYFADKETNDQCGHLIPSDFFCNFKKRQ
jgi:hypothetical protein